MRIQTHSKYNDHVSSVAKCRDFTSGQDAVKLKGQAYLRSLGESTDYVEYLHGATLLGRTQATVKAWSARAAGSDMSTTYPDKSWLEDIDGAGTTIHDIARYCIHELIVAGRVCALVDVDKLGDVTIATYTTENLMDWGCDSGGRVNHVILREELEERDSECVMISKVLYRRLYIDDEGYYKQTVYTDQGDVIEEVTPHTAAGKMEWIPIVIANAQQLSTDIQTSPVRMIADLEEYHYNVWAKLSYNYRYLAGMQLFLSGFTADDGKDLVVSPNFLIQSSNPDAKVSVISPPSCAPLTAELEAVEKRLDALGAHSATLQHTTTVAGAESQADARTAQIDAVRRVTVSVMTKILRYVADFNGIPLDKQVGITYTIVE